MRPRPGILHLIVCVSFTLFTATVCDVKNVVHCVLSPRGIITRYGIEIPPVCLSIYLPDSQGRVGCCQLMPPRHRRRSLPPSLPPSFIHSHVSHHRGFRRKRDNAVCVCVCVCRRLGRLYLSLPLFLLRAVVDVAGGKKEGQNLARLRVTRLCCLRGAREATWMEGGSGMAICYRRHHRQDRKTNREVN